MALSSRPPAPHHPAPPPYRPQGPLLDLFYCQEPEVLVSGPAGTGKSRACLEKLHLCALKYPGMRGLIVRQTRASLTESALVTLEEQVLLAGSATLTGPTRAGRRYYRYPTASEIIVAGLDRPSRIMSTEYDLIYVQEAIELSEDAWEALTTRLRNARMPYQQLLGDTNPAAPSHWLKKRCDAGRTILLESRHQDNPRLWDTAAHAWTSEGRSYLARLDGLTGARKERLRFGRWVQAEGVVYEEWDARVHVLPPRKLPRDWPRWWAVDFGFTNPFVWQSWAADPDTRLYLEREIYQTSLLVEDAAREIRRITAHLPPPRAVICDHDAEDRATLERHLQMRTLPARKPVSPGIQAVKSRLRLAGDRKPRLYVLADCLVHPDPALLAAHRPYSTIQEFDNYTWDPRTGSGRDTPTKEHDHGMDAMRYAVAEVDGLGRRQLKIY